MIPIIFEDEVILVLDKPPGLVVDNSDSDTKNTLENLLRAELGITTARSGIVHRLDKDTSGILVVAKTDQALENLQAQFQSRTVSKKYLALVHGLVDKKGRVVGSLGRNPLNRQKFAVVEDGRKAETEYEPYQHLAFSEKHLAEIFPSKTLKQLHATRYTQFTLLTVHPLTGRTHQIRVHLKYISYPIVGDEKYAGRKTARWDKIWCPRQFLHAKSLEFNHPQTTVRLKFESALPKDLVKALEVLTKI